MPATGGRAGGASGDVDAWSQVHADGLGEWLDAANALHAQSVRAGDARAALACAAGAIERLHRERGAPPAMDRWIDALEHDLALCDDAPRETVDAQLFRAALGVLARRPAHPALPLWHGRAQAELRNPTLGADDQLRGARFAFEFALRSGHFALASALVAGTRAAARAASPGVRIDWLDSEALCAWLSADAAGAERAVAAALAQGAGYGAWEQAASAALARGDLARADACLSEMALRLDPRRTQDVAHARFLAAARCRLGGDDDAAAAHMAACLAVDATDIPPYFTTLWQLGRGHLGVARGATRRAARDLDAVLGVGARFLWGFLHFSALLSRTWLRVRARRHAEALVDLDAALALARLHGYRHCDPWRDPQALAEIAAFARSREHDRATLDLLLGARP
jgi:hypothetical protein